MSDRTVTESVRVARRLSLEELERVTRVIELAIVRHGVPEADLEGTVDDARACALAWGIEVDDG